MAEISILTLFTARLVCALEPLSSPLRTVESRKDAPLTDRMALSEREAYELLAYLIASAETGLVEPAFYGPRRLIDAASRLATEMAPRVGESDRAWLAAFARETSEKKNWARRNPEGFKSFLQESSSGIAGELKRRQGLSSGAETDVQAESRGEGAAE